MIRLVSEDNLTKEENRNFMYIHFYLFFIIFYFLVYVIKYILVQHTMCTYVESHAQNFFTDGNV